MSVDSIGDFLTIIRNGIKASPSKSYVIASYSKLKEEIAGILKNEGFIKDFEAVDVDGKKKIKVILKYVDGESVIHELIRISKPGRRMYGNARSLPHVRGKFGLSILTTNQGIMTDKKARALSVGGEIICQVW